MANYEMPFSEPRAKYASDVLYKDTNVEVALDDLNKNTKFDFVDVNKLTPAGLSIMTFDDIKLIRIGKVRMILPFKLVINTSTSFAKLPTVYDVGMLEEDDRPSSNLWSNVYTFQNNTTQHNTAWGAFFDYYVLSTGEIRFRTREDGTNLAWFPFTCWLVD